MSERPHPTSPPVWYMTVVTGGIAIAALWFGRGLLIPLAITALLFILWAALVDRIRGVSVGGRCLPAWLSHVLAGFVILGTVFLFGAILSSGSSEVAETLPEYRDRLAQFGAKFEALLGADLTASIGRSLAAIDVSAFFAHLAADLAGGLFVAGFIGLYLAFLMSERHLWLAKIPKLAGHATDGARAQRILSRISDSVKQYMWVNAVTSAMSGTVAYIIFSLVGLDFAKFLALIVFVVGFIPNIGAFIGIALPSLVAFLQFDTIWPFIFVLVGYGFSDQFISNVIQPMMQGRSLNISTFMIMVALAFWSILWGGIGAFLAIPLMVVVMIIFAEFPATRWIAVLLSADGDLELPEE